jgi:hypothetical protein
MIPKVVIEVRNDICRDCSTPCPSRLDTIHACSFCPVRKWGKYGNCEANLVPCNEMRGLGDLVAKIAEPIAKVLHLDTNKCGCEQRKEWLNNKVPFN